MSMTFSALWNAHPEVHGDDNPCRRRDGHKAFDNQCTIRLGTALARCGYDVTKLHVHFCWLHPKSAGHILRAEELADALKRTSIPGVFPAIKVHADNFEDVLKNRTGIIFFKDYWRRDNESFVNRSGDHIDLWNGSRLTSFFSYARIQWGFSVEGFLSDFFNSKEVWFWRVL
ncbi:type VI secretion system amidase effector protein Tae4 [Pseudescherichia sp.]|uniref:type VI secretion system amidase effector protein Tae4 n=1 Tax=Pseudescherichia sp. TaxID=2055881 RepID=UPI00289C7C84|nr:type VI secretion system amidase effector protein Tae4 [Pseudescherichia sp.]